MKYSINIDQINSLAWDLNLSEAAVFTYLFHVPTWADPVLIDGETFYFAARQKTCQDVPLISDKPDTIYRIYKSLAEKGVIEYLKHMGKDCMKITEKGKGWNSEKNPSSTIELGKKSESTRKIFRKDSEKNPTYKSTIYNHTILLDKEEVEKEFSTVLIDSEEDLVMEIHHVPDYFEEDTSKSASDLVDIFYAELNSKATQKPKEKSGAKKEKVDNPTPIKPMFEIYSDQYAKMNGGEKPEFMTKYCQPMKKLYGILEARQIQSGIVPLDKLQPWRDFIEMWGKYLQDHSKETYFTANFNPATFYSQFNTIVAKLRNQPMTTVQKWDQFYRENTTG